MLAGDQHKVGASPVIGTCAGIGYNGYRINDYIVVEMRSSAKRCFSFIGLTQCKG